MLKQEINLYYSFAKPKPVTILLSWKQYMLCLLLGFLFLSIVAIYNSTYIYYLSNKKAEKLREITTLKSQFYAMKNQFPKVFFSKDVGQTVSELQQQLDTQTKILQTLKSPISFAQTLSELSNIILPDIWLTKITISNEEGKITLEGNSLSLPAIQQFLSIITQNAIFAGYTAKMSDLQTTDNSKKQFIHFEFSLMKKSA